MKKTVISRATPTQSLFSPLMSDSNINETKDTIHAKVKRIGMNKYFILILLSVITNVANSRNWNLLKTGKQWNILLVTYNADMVHHDSTTYYIKFDGDTVIGSLKYKRVFRATKTDFTDKALQGCAREDSTTGLYFRNLTGDEGPLYKYNLKIGDSIAIQNKLVKSLGIDSIKYKVTNIDSILISGVYKKRYTMSEKNHSSMPETWIEGVGSSLGILGNGLHPSGAGTQLLCCSSNNTLIYKNPAYQNCYYLVRTALQPTYNSVSELGISLGSANNITIKSPLNNYVKIFNSYGIFVETINIQANQDYDLNISNYPKGIYIISPTNSQLSAKKFIVY